MIKDRITSELKRRFSEEIKKTSVSNKERGFLICTDKQGNLSPTPASCEGEECILRGLALISFQCPYKIQGDFHTHAGIDKAKKLMERKYNKIISDEDARAIITNGAKKIGVTVTSPSHGDVLNSLITRYNNIALGTVCIGTDVDATRVECWSIQKKINKKDNDRAMAEVDINLANDILKIG